MKRIGIIFALDDVLSVAFIRVRPAVILRVGQGGHLDAVKGEEGREPYLIVVGGGGWRHRRNGMPGRNRGERRPGCARGFGTSPSWTLPGALFLRNRETRAPSNPECRFRSIDPWATRRPRCESPRLWL